MGASRICAMVSGKYSHMFVLYVFMLFLVEFCDVLVFVSTYICRVPVKPVPGALTINTGDMMQVVE